MTLSAREINELATYRYQQMFPFRKMWDTLGLIYQGRHAEMFPDEFPAGDVAKVAGLIRHSWKMFVRLTAQEPTIYVAPLTQTPKGLKDQDKLEKILYGYNGVWAMPRKMEALSMFRVGFGAVGCGVVPDPRSGWPQLLIEDPRNCLPGAGWTSSSTSGLGYVGINLDPFSAQQDFGVGYLDDMIVRKTMTGRQIHDTFPGADLSDALIPRTVEGYNRPYSVLQFYDKNRWVSVLDGTDVTLADSPHGCPWCPWYFSTNFSPDMAAGDSDYYQQIGLEVAFLRILAQKLALNDAIAYPWLQMVGIFDVDPVSRKLQATSPDAKASFLTPPPEFQVDRDMQTVRDLVRMLNSETEASQGQLPGGPITGQGIAQLNQPSLVETVQHYFKDYAYFIPRLYASALVEDRTIFPTQTKDLAGWARGETFFTSYTPATDIGMKIGRIDADFGPGLGGYQGHIQMLQDLGAEAISVETVMEKNPHIRSVRVERNRIFLQKMDALVLASLEGKAAVPPEWIAACSQAVGNGTDWREYVLANPPGQSAATPGNVPPVPPEVAAAQAAQGSSPGPPGAGPGGLPGAGAPSSFQGAPGPGQNWNEPGPNVWAPRSLSHLLGGR